MSAPRTKPGKHGPLYLYAYVYRDVTGRPTFTARAWRYSLEHLVDAFEDGPDAEGWELVSAQRVIEDGTRYGSVTHATVHRFTR